MSHRIIIWLFPQQEPYNIGLFSQKELYRILHCVENESRYHHMALSCGKTKCTRERQCVAVCCSVLQCVAVCCSALQCIAVYCSVLHCVAVCCIVLQCVAVCCSVFQCVPAWRRRIEQWIERALYYRSFL